MFNKLKLTSWADIMYIVTIIYTLFLISVSCIDYTVYDISGKKHYTITILDFWCARAQPLKGWKGKMLIGCMFVLAIIVDRILIKFFWIKFTKQYKIAKYQLNKEYQKMIKEKENESTK